LGDHSTIQWPPKCDLFGVQVSCTTYGQALEAVAQAVRAGVPALVAHLPVHGLMTAVGDRSFCEMVNAFDIVAPDGQPVRWALNRLYRAGLPDRVYGPEFVLRLCERAARDGFGVYLYGSRPDVVARLKAALEERFPALRVVGHEAPPFRPLTAEEDAAAVERMNRSGAAVVFVGLGCPKQETFAYEHRDRIRAVQVCVGAAFEFHSGHKAMAPRWMQQRGLEWLHRLLQEPRRLGWRYLWSNTAFLCLLAARLLTGPPADRPR
jgi:N-acetylglucosaminyldiphosphoundecaprenol N-acetyl-beta-D-mannosaminyltransferase